MQDFLNTFRYLLFNSLTNHVCEVNRLLLCLLYDLSFRVLFDFRSFHFFQSLSVFVSFLRMLLPICCFSFMLLRTFNQTICELSCSASLIFFFRCFPFFTSRGLTGNFIFGSSVLLRGITSTASTQRIILFSLLYLLHAKGCCRSGFLSFDDIKNLLLL